MGEDFSVRVDKWLWAVRIFKTRSDAADACRTNRVLINGAFVKPSREIKVGDTVTVKKMPVTYTYRVAAMVSSRQPAKNVPDYVEESMQIQARLQISKMEKGMNYLAITASVAPMLGFLGTIFGVIRIFYDISKSGVLDISTISNGLYEKMICSGTGLLVGIIAYSGYSLLNNRIDKIVLQMDVVANEALKAIRADRDHAVKP